MSFEKTKNKVIHNPSLRNLGNIRNHDYRRRDFRRYRSRCRHAFWYNRVLAALEGTQSDHRTNNRFSSKRCSGFSWIPRSPFLDTFQCWCICSVFVAQVFQRVLLLSLISRGFPSSVSDAWCALPLCVRVFTLASSPAVMCNTFRANHRFSFQLFRSEFPISVLRFIVKL